MPANAPTPAIVLRGYYEDLDSPTPERILDRLADDFRFSILFATDGGAQEFSGATQELTGYLEQRGPTEWRHELGLVEESGRFALATGHVRQGDQVIATFMTTMQIDPFGRVVRFLTARVPDGDVWT